MVKQLQDPQGGFILMPFIVIMKRKYQNKALQMRFLPVSILSYSLSFVD
jgi:hypothetical protein